MKFAVPSSSTVFSGRPTVTATTITVSSNFPSLVVLTRFVVEWQRDASVGCSDVDEDTTSVTGAFISYTITGLEPGNRYTITVTVSSSFRDPVRSSVTAVTEEAGRR